MGKYHCAIDLLFDWFGLVCFKIKTQIVSCHTADSKPVKREVNRTVILPPLVFPAWTRLHPTDRRIGHNQSGKLGCPTKRRRGPLKVSIYKKWLNFSNRLVPFLFVGVDCEYQPLIFNREGVAPFSRN